MSDYRYPTKAEWDVALMMALNAKEPPRVAMKEIAEKNGWERWKGDDEANPILRSSWKIAVDIEIPKPLIPSKPLIGGNAGFDRSYIHIVVTPEMGGLERGVNLNQIMMEASRLVRERIGNSASVATILTMNPSVSLAHLVQIDDDIKKGRTTPNQSQVNTEN